MENELNKLIDAYLEKFPKDSGKLFTLQLQTGDEDLLKILQDANGRRIVLGDEQNNLDDGAISWRYE